MIRVGADLRVRPQGIQRSNEDGRTHRSAPTEIGVTAFDEWNCRVDVIRVGVTAFDEWNCRADVACVGADLRVRPLSSER